MEPGILVHQHPLLSSVPGTWAPRRLRLVLPVATVVWTCCSFPAERQPGLASGGTGLGRCGSRVAGGSVQRRVASGSMQGVTGGAAGAHSPRPDGVWGQIPGVRLSVWVPWVSPPALSAPLGPSHSCRDEHVPPESRLSSVCWFFGVGYGLGLVAVCVWEVRAKRDRDHLCRQAQAVVHCVQPEWTGLSRCHQTGAHMGVSVRALGQGSPWQQTPQEAFPP